MSSLGRVVASGLSAQQRKLDAIANNIANLDTVGFKRTRVEFKDLAYRPAVQVATDPAGMRTADGSLGQGAEVSATELMLGQGVIEDTGNPLDLAIEGAGFFQVRRPDGTVAYTRDGSFTVDAQNRVVTQAGLPLEPAITLPAGATLVGVDVDGSVWAQVGDAAPQIAGKITLARFPNPEGLAPVGGNLFAATAASGNPTTAAPGTAGYGGLVAGALEGSNVDLAEETTRMLQAQRAYQMGLQALRSWDEVATRAVRIRS